MSHTEPDVTISDSWNTYALLHDAVKQQEKVPNF